MGIARAADLGGGKFFDVQSHMNDVALVIEPKRIDKDVSSTYNNITRVRDEVVADVTIFATSEALEKGVPSEFQGGVIFSHGMLTSSLEKVMGEAMVGIIRKTPTKAGMGYVFKSPEGRDEDAAIAWYEAREAAIAAAVADAPDFDD